MPLKSEEKNYKHKRELWKLQDLVYRFRSNYAHVGNIRRKSARVTYGGRRYFKILKLEVKDFSKYFEILQSLRQILTKQRENFEMLSKALQSFKFLEVTFPLKTTKSTE